MKCFIEETSKLCDVAFCKCADFSRCTCPKDKKVHVLERQFLLDQRGPRSGRIGSVDLPVTKEIIKRDELSCKRLKPDTSLSESSYSNAVSHSLSNDSQHFGDDVEGVENKAEDNFVQNDRFTKRTLNKILSARQDEVENLHQSIRYNIIPQLNFEAKDYTDMILWESTDISITVPQVL